jgi:hypothetical protein
MGMLGFVLVLLLELVLDHLDVMAYGVCEQEWKN